MAAIAYVKSNLRLHQSSGHLRIANASLVKGDGFDHRIELLPGSNLKLPERSTCNAGGKHDVSHRELQIDYRIRLIVNRRDAGRENVEYTYPRRLLDGK